MTLDEAIKHCEEVARQQEQYAKGYAQGDAIEVYDAFDCDECAQEHRQLAEWLKELKAYKEQLPCEDCISRQAAIEAMGEQPLNWTDTPEEIAEEKMWEDHIKALKELPSVTPARTRGEWMTEHNRGYVQCSNCHNRVPFCKRSNFCPNCGSYNGG